MRGIPSPQVSHNVDAVIRAVGLQAFSSRMAAALSGGNKRKLSLGIALIGNPTVLLLDEPSSGMDAAAKRVMWKTLAAVVPGRSLLLTTHSMEEADALADRAGIMAKRMLALGTSDHLRERFGGNYYVHLVMASAPHTSDLETEKVKAWIATAFPGADIEDKTYHGQIRFSVPISSPLPLSPSAKQTVEIETETASASSDSIHGGREKSDPHNNVAKETGIGKIIMKLEDSRQGMGLEYYSVSPTTLDQVFLSCVGKHNVEEEGYVSDTKKEGNSLWKKIMRR